MQSLSSLPALAPALLCLMLLGACGAPAEPPPDTGDGTEGGLDVGGIALYDESGRNFAWSHGDHWHGYIAVNRGQPYNVKFKFMKRVEEHASDPATHFTLAEHTELTLRVPFDDPTLVSFTGDHVQGRFDGQHAGDTRATFTLREGMKVLLQTPSVRAIIRE